MIISLYQNIHLSYIKNKDGKATNPMISAHSKIDTKTNKLVSISYSVKAFEKKETCGYHNKNYKSFNKALDDYDKICTDPTHLEISKNYSKDKLL